jgi:hypothetical protein
VLPSNTRSKCASGNFTEGVIDGHGVHSWDDGASFEGDTQSAQSHTHLHKRYILPKSNIYATSAHFNAIISACKMYSPVAMPCENYYLICCIFSQLMP